MRRDGVRGTRGAIHGAPAAGNLDRAAGNERLRRLLRQLDHAAHRLQHIGGRWMLAHRQRRGGDRGAQRRARGQHEQQSLSRVHLRWHVGDRQSRRPGGFLLPLESQGHRRGQGVDRGVLRSTGALCVLRRLLERRPSRAAHVRRSAFPNDYDGILAGAPTIDNTATNTLSHAWNVRVISRRRWHGRNSSPPTRSPVLAKAVLAACADSSGMIAGSARMPFQCGVELICRGGGECGPRA